MITLRVNFGILFTYSFDQQTELAQFLMNMHILKSPFICSAKINSIQKG